MEEAIEVVEPTPEEVRKVMAMMGRRAQAKHPELKENLTGPGIPECTCGKPSQKSGRTRSGRNPGRLMWRRRHTKTCPAGVWFTEHYPNQGKGHNPHTHKTAVTVNTDTEGENG